MSERVDVAINGYGRIGTILSRIAIGDPLLSLKAINAGKNPRDPYDAAARLEFDSKYLRFGDHTVDYDDNNLIIDDETRIALLGFRALADARWQDIGSDNLTVIESTGHFTTREAIQGHLDAGAQRVVITAPAKDDVTPTIVRGVNDTPENLSKIEDVVAVSSCSTNAIAPVLKALESDFKLIWGAADVPHAYTNSQTPLDSNGKDASSRRALDAEIPASTGSAKEVFRLFPHLKFFRAGALRIPTTDASVALMTVEVEGTISKEDVQESLEQASATTHDGIIGIITGLGQEDMFSKRIIKRPESSVINPNQVSVDSTGSTSIIRLQSWFDNEWGYANRVVEVAKMIAQSK